MPKNLGNMALIASTATFTLLVFQAFAVVPPLKKPLDHPQPEQPQVSQAPASHHPVAYRERPTVQRSHSNY